MSSAVSNMRAHNLRRKGTDTHTLRDTQAHASKHVSTAAGAESTHTHPAKLFARGPVGQRGRARRNAGSAGYELVDRLPAVLKHGVRWLRHVKLGAGQAATCFFQQGCARNEMLNGEEFSVNSDQTHYTTVTQSISANISCGNRIWRKKCLSHVFFLCLDFLATRD